MAGGTSRPERGVRRGEGFIQERPQRDGTMRYQARWPEAQPDGRVRYRSRTVATLDDAEDLLRQMARDRRDGRYIPPVTLTVGDLIESWLERGRRRWAASSYGHYRRAAERHIIPSLGRVEARSLTTHRVQHWVDGLSDAGFKPGSVSLWLNLLRLALSEAVRLGIMATNPAGQVITPPDRRKAPPTWTATEVRAVMQAIGDDPLWRAVYMVALTTGIRPGELRALTWADTDLDGRILEVRRTVTRDAARRQVIGSGTKTGRDRLVALTSGTTVALRAWRVEQNLRRLVSANWRDLDLVFASRTGQLLGDNTWRHQHRLIIERAGVTPITLHQLRHTNATLDISANPKTVSDRLGHASVAFTLNRYSHVSMEQQREAAEALGHRLFDEPEPAELSHERDNIQ